jgi:hypothetical protein
LYRYSGLSESEFEYMKERAEKHTPMHRVVLPEEVAKAIVFLTSDKAMRITGHVMKVDGGKSLTSLSTIDWYGTDVMNRRYEAKDNALSKMSYFFKEMKEKWFDPAKVYPKDSSEYIQAKQKSAWATHSEEAHEKVKADYGAYRIDNDKNLEYERAQMWGGSNNPARATQRSAVDFSTYGRNTQYRDRSTNRRSGGYY